MTAMASPRPAAVHGGIGQLVVPDAVRPFAVVAAVAVVAGGLAAAVTRPTGWDDGSWVAAYLVLVTGVGQLGLAVGQSALTAGLVGRATVARELVLLNGGSALVVAGTLASAPLLTTLGGVVLAAALVTFLAAVRVPAAADASVRAVRWTYALLLTTLIVSTPIGLVLAWLRA